MKYHPWGGCRIRPKDDAKADVSDYNETMKLFKILGKIITKYHLIGDGAIFCLEDRKKQIQI